MSMVRGSLMKIEASENLNARTSSDSTRVDGVHPLITGPGFKILTGPGFKGSSHPSHFIFEINVGKTRFRHITTLKLNDEFLE